MSMVTRCPRCDTTFRVTLAHLRAREGYVRCGRCSEVFNALTTLSAMTSDADSGSVPAEVLPASSDFLASEDVDKAVPWGALCAAAAIALVLQLGYLFRTDMATRLPSIAPYLAAVCAQVGCSIAPAVDPRDFAITDSDLRADAVRSDVVVLSLMLKNQAEQARAYPALELTLTDAQNRTVARRVFTAKEYAGKNPRTLAPHSEIPLELALEVGDLNASGYRLYLFYP